MHLNDTPDVTPTKQCTKCGEVKPATTEYFPRNRRQRDGLYYWCKPCNSEHVRKWNAANLERKRQKDRELYRANSQRYKDNARRWRKANPERKRENDRRWDAANQDKERERKRKWEKDHPDIIQERSRKKYILHKERIEERNRAWAKANPERRRAISLRRRAREANAEGTHTAQDIKHQYKAQKGKCYYCGVKVGKTYHVEHVVPLSRGGSNDPSNLVIACAPCNQSKNDKLPHEWPQGNRLL